MFWRESLCPMCLLQILSPSLGFVVSFPQQSLSEQKSVSWILNLFPLKSLCGIKRELPDGQVSWKELCEFQGPR